MVHNLVIVLNVVVGPGLINAFASDTASFCAGSALL